MPPNRPVRLEICVDAPASVAAVAGIADRIELCSALDLGGLTPDIGLMEMAAKLGIETHVLIRPRSGDFQMSDDDLAAAVSSIRAANQLGLAGVVIGAESDGALDRSALDLMIRASDGMHVTLHRVIDVVDDPIAALETAVDAGAGRILTSGGAVSAINGISGLNALHKAAAGRIEIMAGAGLTSRNLPELLARTEITSVHASCSSQKQLEPRYGQFGFGEYARSIDLAEVTRIKALCADDVADA